MISNLKDNKDYRGYIGHPAAYDLHAINQLSVLSYVGLRDFHTVLDLGCGSLRLGRILIPFLLPDKYFGIEPDFNLVSAGFEFEIGWDITRIKRPKFSNATNFNASNFGVNFDYIIAHSIFTHTPFKLAIDALRSICETMNENSILVATFIEDNISSVSNSDAWVYPDCLAYSRNDIYRMFSQTELHAKPLNFPHTCQNWWVASKNSIIIKSL
jgi:SAM-dependent methyltransferase